MLWNLGFSFKSKLLKSQLSRTLIIRILLISGLFSIISIALQLLSEYQYEKTRLHTSTREIAYSYADLVNLQLSESNDTALQKTLDSIVNFESISRALVKTEINGVTDKIKMESGIQPEDSDRFSVSLIIPDWDNNFATPVILEVVSDYTVAQNKVIDKLIIIGLSQGSKTFVVSLFILFFIHKMVIRHVNEISRWLNNYDPKYEFTPLKKRKDKVKRNEIDNLRSSVCNMANQIHEYTVSLEQVVDNRTAELNQRTKELETAQQELHKILWKKEQKLKGVSQAINDWLWDLDQFGNITTMSPELAEKIDLNLDASCPHQLLLELPFVNNVTTDESKSFIAHSLSQKAAFESCQCCITLTNGESMWLSLSASPYFSEQGEFLGFHGSATDITQKKHLERLAYTDNLTGIANRVAFFHRVDKELHRAKRLSYDTGVVMLDIDHFKKINDNFGHHAGDVVLQKVAVAIEQCLREEDCVGRIGGEEFAIIVPGADKSGLEQVAKRLRQSIGELTFNFMPADKNITVSIGFTLLLENESFTDAMNRADQHLYRAKANGRDCYVTDLEECNNYVI